LAKTEIGLDENIAAVVAYLIMPLSSIVLLVMEKNNNFVKFHAMQATIVGIILFVAMTISSMLVFVLIGLLLMPIVGLVGLVLWLLLMFKAYKGEMYKLPVIGDIAEKQIKK